MVAKWCCDTNIRMRNVPIMIPSLIRLYIRYTHHSQMYLICWYVLLKAAHNLAVGMNRFPTEGVSSSLTLTPNLAAVYFKLDGEKKKPHSAIMLFRYSRSWTNASTLIGHTQMANTRQITSKLCSTGWNIYYDPSLFTTK